MANSFANMTDGVLVALLVISDTIHNSLSFSFEEFVLQPLIQYHVVQFSYIPTARCEEIKHLHG